MMKIPLNPPFSKGEMSPTPSAGNEIPPFRKGGKGGFERLYLDECN